MGHYVVFVHGIGEQQEDSHDSFGQRIKDSFEKQVQKVGQPKPADGEFVWVEAFWADINQPGQEELKRLVPTGGRLRDFLIGSMGDAIAYSKLPYPPDKYGEIQKRFVAKVDLMKKKAAEASDSNGLLTVIAHSLGTVIASDGLYELEKNGTFTNNFRFANFFTLGSPIALYGLRFGLSNFDKPVRPEHWSNFRYPQDLIGFPLQVLNEAYRQAVTEDIMVRPGRGSGRLTEIVRSVIGRLPLAGITSHSWYFTNKMVIDTIGRKLAGY